MAKPNAELRILMLEDVQTDAELEECALRDAGLAFTLVRVDTREAFMLALDEFKPDIVLADYRLPAYNGRAALEYTRLTHPQIPVIMVTGALGDEAAVELLKLGACDYVLKDHLARLVSAISRALAEERSFQERKLAEAALRESEEYFRGLFENARDVILTLTGEGTLTKLSPYFEQISGWTCADWLGKLFFALVHPDDLPDVVPLLERAMQGEELPSFELRILKKSGDYFTSEFTIAPLTHNGKITHLLGIARDITERKHAEEDLRKINRALRTLSAGNLALVKAADQSSLLDDVCRIIVDIGEYRMAWVGYPADDALKSIIPMACQGVTKDDLASLQLTWADAARGQGALAGAIRSGQLQIRRDILKDASFEFYQQLAVAHDWNANLAVPLSDGQRVFGALSIFSADPNAFDAGEVALLNELGSDLAFGINALHTRTERDQAAEKSRQYLDQIRTNLTDAIQAIATTIEMRDAYTAGHQRRVSELAVAIARELGLPQEMIAGLHLAAVIHDLGKISIPAEILSKPAKLSLIEFELIKVHPQSGYEILKGIDFPWPIAQIVLQHHERLDGSGYPQKLKGEMLLTEAKILAVADVVEAMASHRPYRPTLGIDAALDEITRNQGKFYDPGAVGACLSLFRKKAFAFSDGSAR
ncbi:MAG: HD domain-containing phosphohydrolase [Sterolibacterium sp.]